MNSNILLINGPGSIGHLSARRLLDEGATVTLLLSTPFVFDPDETMRQYAELRKVQIVHGNATTQSHVQNAWDKAANFGPVNLLIFATDVPSFVTQDSTMQPEDLLPEAVLNTLLTAPHPHPKTIVITPEGIIKALNDVVSRRLPAYSFIESESEPTPLDSKSDTEPCIPYSQEWETGTEEKQSKVIPTAPQWTGMQEVPAPRASLLRSIFRAVFSCGREGCGTSTCAQRRAERRMCCAERMIAFAEQRNINGSRSCCSRRRAGCGSRQAAYLGDGDVEFYGRHRWGCGSR